MTEIAALAKARGLLVVEDCAEAPGARYDGKPVGSFSDIACFSFYGNKIVTTGEGGMCLTDNPDLAARMRILRDHGMRPERSYWHEEPGFNFRMTNLQAAIGCAQMEQLAGFLERKRRLAGSYRDAFAGLPGVSFVDEPAESRSNFWLNAIIRQAAPEGGTGNKQPRVCQGFQMRLRTLRNRHHIDMREAECRHLPEGRLDV